MSHAESADGSSAHRLPEGPREFLRRVGFGYVHGRFAEALETVGCLGSGVWSGSMTILFGGLRWAGPGRTAILIA